MEPIIKVEGLGKKYVIRHEQQERYTALRDVMARNVKKIFSFPQHLRAGKPSAQYEEFWALKDLNFEIQQGDRVGIIGRNGAGKSTLLKILSRITEPSTGRIELNGRVASLLEVGTGFHPELTGRENIYLNGAILGMSRAEIKKKFDEIVDFSGVEKFLDTPVKRYSSGMYVRLAFAVAAHLEPEILVVDEVLAVGDAEFQKKCLGKMEDVSKNEGRTVLFVSHNTSALSALCNRGIVLRDSKVVFDENINKSISFYKNDSGWMNEKIMISDKKKWRITDFKIIQNKTEIYNINAIYPVFAQIQFEGELLQNLSFELSLKDSSMNAICFIALGIGQNINFQCDSGVYVLDFKIDLPILSIGEYYFDLFIVESFVKKINIYENIRKIDVVSCYIGETGWVFENNGKMGPFLCKVSEINFKKIF